MYLQDLSFFQSVPEMDMSWGEQIFLEERACGASQMEQQEVGPSTSMATGLLSTFSHNSMSVLMEEYSNNRLAFKNQIYTQDPRVQHFNFITRMNSATLIITIILIMTVSSFRFTLTESQPSFSMYMDTKGKQTFVAISSGE